MGLREANPWQGHSPLTVAPYRPVRFAFRDSATAEGGGWSAVFDGATGQARLYDARADWLQRHDRAAERPPLARACWMRPNGTVGSTTI